MLDRIKTLLEELERRGEMNLSDVMVVWTSSSVHSYLKYLVNHKFLEEDEIKDGRRRYKRYALTPKGRKLLELLRQLETLEKA